MKKTSKVKKKQRSLALSTVADDTLRASIKQRLPAGFSGTVIYHPEKVEFVRAANDDKAQDAALRAWGRQQGRKRLLKITF